MYRREAKASCSTKLVYSCMHQPDTECWTQNEATTSCCRGARSFENSKCFGILDIWKMIFYLHGYRSIIECTVIAIDCEILCAIATRDFKIHDYCMPFIFGLECSFFLLSLSHSFFLAFYNIVCQWSEMIHAFSYYSFHSIITCCRVSHAAIFSLNPHTHVSYRRFNVEVFFVSSIPLALDCFEDYLQYSAIVAGA